MIDGLANKIKTSLDKKTKLLTAEDVVAKHGVERREAIEVLKKLEQWGLGQFKVGRGSSGHFKTRIEFKNGWYETLSAVPPVPVIENNEPRVDSAECPKRACIPHIFPLDETLNAQLTLPRDLSKSEAERLIKFVESLARRE